MLLVLADQLRATVPVASSSPRHHCMLAALDLGKPKSEWMTIEPSHLYGFPSFGFA